MATAAARSRPFSRRCCLDYAVACGVEDLQLQLDGGGRRGSHGGAGSPRRTGVLTLHFPVGSPLLVRLSVRGLHLTASAKAMVATFGVIHLHSMSITDAALRWVVAACPCLREPELCYCRHLRRIDFTTGGATNLRSLTVVDCSSATELRVPVAPRLRSFRFNGPILCSILFSGITQCFEHLYLCFGRPETGLPPTNVPSAIPYLSNLTGLTLCSIALQSNLPRLRELQLLMFGMANSNLTDIFSFLKTCCYPQLERPIAQLPTNTRDSFTKNYLEVAEEEPPGGGLENLRLVKMTNFKGHHNEMHLVDFLLRKANCLDQLFLVAPKEDHAQGFRKVQSEMLPYFLKTEILLHERASVNTLIVFNEPDGSQVQPLHSEVFVKF